MKTRIRRTAEDAKEQILDAAEAQLVAGGPDSLRLQQIAADVGISHTAVLHHFGSRKGLVKAVVERTGARLHGHILAAAEGPFDHATAATLMDQLFRRLREAGTARLLVWLFLAQDEPVDPVGYGDRLRRIAELVHARRGRRDAAFEDTLFTVLLAGLAMFGDAVAGEALRASAGLPADDATEQRFTAWLAHLLHDHLDR